MLSTTIDSKYVATIQFCLYQKLNYYIYRSRVAITYPQAMQTIQLCHVPISQLSHLRGSAL